MPQSGTTTSKVQISNYTQDEEDTTKIEALAYASANQYFEKEPDDYGSSAVQLYAKELSKLMLEVVKRDPKAKKNGEVIIAEKVTTSHEIIFDISGGRLAFIDADEAEELLKPPLKEPGSKYTKICFSKRSFGLDEARFTEAFLSSLKDQLTKVDLSDFIQCKLEIKALEVMKIFSSVLEGCELRYLNVSNNALGGKGVRAFGSLLKSQRNLEELHLMNDGFSEEAAQAVCELIPSTEKLRVLQFHNNMTGDEEVIAISKLVKHSPVLEDFQYFSTRVDSEGGVVLAKALGTCSHLKKLDWRDNMFGVEAGIALNKALPGFANPIEVYQSYLNLEDEGSIALVNVLKETAHSLEVLEMAGNDTSAEAAPALVGLLAAGHLLTKLNLSDNDLKDEGTILIPKALEQGQCQLNEVDLITNLIRRVRAKLLAQAVIAKPGFKLLNINGNFVYDEGVDEVNDVLKSFPSMLGPLDENDPEREDYDEEESDSESKSESANSSFPSSYSSSSSDDDDEGLGSVKTRPIMSKHEIKDIPFVRL